MSLSRTVSEIKGNIGQIFPPRVFNGSAEGFPLKFCNGVRPEQTRMMSLAEFQKVRHLHSFSHSISMGQTDRQTDRRTGLVEQYHALCTHSMLTRDKKKKEIKRVR